MSKNLDQKFKDLKKSFAGANQNADLKLLDKAWKFAKMAHAGQKRLSGDEFVAHPLAVAQTLVHWKLDLTTIIAGLLHDTVEDTKTTRSDIVEHFGADVARIVSGVTKVTDLRLVGSKEKVRVETLRKMILVMSRDLRVVFVKLADRIHNMQTLSFLSKKKQIENSRETMEIYAPLAERLGIGEAKSILENLSFFYLYPDEYKKLAKESKKYYAHAKVALEKAKRRLAIKLKNLRIIARIDAREKSLYSLWRKLQRSEVSGDIENIHDLIALRIIVETVGECYVALGIVHSSFKPVPKLGVSDFIAQPKPNGYRSIHTKVFCNGNILEIQIRTKEMHDEAEHGLAAHWAYSEAKSSDTGDEILQKGHVYNKLTWVKKLVEWQKEMVDSSEFLNAVKFDAFQHRNFVFTPKGDVYDLPRNATPIDFAYAIHTDLARFIKSAKVNSKIVPLDYALKSGDVVEIIKAKNPRSINRDWLRFVATTEAKREIKKQTKK